MKTFVKIYTQSDDHKQSDLCEIEITGDCKIHVSGMGNPAKEGIKKLDGETLKA